MKITKKMKRKFRKGTLFHAELTKVKYWYELQYLDSSNWVSLAIQFRNKKQANKECVERRNRLGYKYRLILVRVIK